MKDDNDMDGARAAVIVLLFLWLASTFVGGCLYAKLSARVAALEAPAK